MGGGLLQLVAYGAQDVYLTGNPQITFFKVVYRRHTNFAMESIEQSFNGNNNFGSTVSVLITRNGDLIHRIYYSAKVSNTDSTTTNSFDLVPYFGQRLLKTIELEIGGQKIDKHYSEWLYIWNELSMPVGKKEGYLKMVGGTKDHSNIALKGTEKYEVYVPLEFWFCRNVGLALPLIALQYHEVKINISYASAADIVVAGTSAVSNAALNDVSLWVDYIFLDTDERRRFAQLSHEYLIEQLQFTGSDNITASADANTMKSSRMTFNHPCKELIWTIHDNLNTGSDKWNKYSTSTTHANPVQKAKIQLNGNDRMAERDGTYFSRVQPYQHHENTPSVFVGDGIVPNDSGINVYSFALKPEEHQPSGTLNMSRIDTAVLSVSSSVEGNLSIYAVNYNVLRIMSGMGGLAYSN
jgi:hypothetical protein